MASGGPSRGPEGPSSPPQLLELSSLILKAALFMGACVGACVGMSLFLSSNNERGNNG